MTVDTNAKGVMVGVDETYQMIVSNAENMVFGHVDAVILDSVTAEYLYSRINRKPKDARLEVKDNSQIIHDHEVGISVDFAKVSEKVEAGEKTFELDIDVSMPEVTSEKLKSVVFVDVLGEYTTRYNAGTAGRAKNISLSAGDCVYPHEYSRRKKRPAQGSVG